MKGVQKAGSAPGQVGMSHIEAPTTPASDLQSVIIASLKQWLIDQSMRCGMNISPVRQAYCYSVERGLGWCLTTNMGFSLQVISLNPSSCASTYPSTHPRAKPQTPCRLSWQASCPGVPPHPQNQNLHQIQHHIRLQSPQTLPHGC